MSISEGASLRPQFGGLQRASQRKNQYDRLEPLPQNAEKETVFFARDGVKIGKRFQVLSPAGSINRTGRFHSPLGNQHQQQHHLHKAAPPQEQSTIPFRRDWTHQSLPASRRLAVLKMESTDGGIHRTGSFNSPLRNQHQNHQLKAEPPQDQLTIPVLRDGTHQHPSMDGHLIPQTADSIITTTKPEKKGILRVKTNEQVDRYTYQQILPRFKTKSNKTVHWPDQQQEKPRPLSSSFSEDQLNKLGVEKENKTSDFVQQNDKPIKDEVVEVDNPVESTDELLLEDVKQLVIEQLHYAIDDKSKETVKKLIEQVKGNTQVSVIEGLKDGMTPLQRACETDLVEVAALLVTYGAEVNTCNKVAMPIALAYQAMNTEMCAGLIVAGSKLPPAISAYDILQLIINADDADALESMLNATTLPAESIYNLDSMSDYVKLLKAALRDEKLECAAVLISFGVEYQQSFPNVPLAFAAEHNCLGLAYELCWQGEVFTSAESCVYIKLMKLAIEVQDRDYIEAFEQQLVKSSSLKKWNSIRRKSLYN
ncbi:ankyrin repeat domain-containing protein [Parashewanella spongiae]|uniref:Ankyrin repeat domain-containing protein n=1 Tax=Parashewanella spongiae TaxID=342950 RepID=A0A3A6UBI0_9GAMM|nr:ankyrin repeat domain-containing protein [Parashewanella spongiae]MCL1078937.1 ankyrin repeat domain-containing protein [Parashewanella spongiae]RJY19368.1 ankyrin repeat domain-containing protein [Parashewanella spongiae]